VSGWVTRSSPTCVRGSGKGFGSAVTPLLIDAWGARGTLIATGLLLVVLAAAFLPRLTAIDATISAPGPDLALLRQVSFFPLPFAEEVISTRLEAGLPGVLEVNQ
jgi:hypothetical protein